MNDAEIQWRIATQIKAGRLDLKYAYLGKDGAERHLAHATSDGYEVLALSPLASFLTIWAGQFDLDGGPIELVDFGSGSGATAAQMVDFLRQGGLEVSRVTLVDFSIDLLHVAIETLRRRQSGIRIDSHVTDLELGPDPALEAVLHGTRPRSRVHLLIGGTLGNVANPGILCQTLVSYCRQDDVLVVSVALSSGEAGDPVELRDYNTENFLSGILSPLAALDIPLSACTVATVYNGGERAYVACARFLETVVVKRCEEEFVFPKGSTFEAFRSRRFLPDELAELLSSNGWTIMVNHIHEGQSWVQARLSR